MHTEYMTDDNMLYEKTASSGGNRIHTEYVTVDNMLYDKQRLQMEKNAYPTRGGGRVVLGKLPVPGRPTIWITVEQGPTALAVGAGGGCWTFLLSSVFFSPLSLSLWETARYRLKYYLKGPLNPKQPTNQPIEHLTVNNMQLEKWHLQAERDCKPNVTANKIQSRLYCMLSTVS